VEGYNMFQRKKCDKPIVGWTVTILDCIDEICRSNSTKIFSLDDLYKYESKIQGPNNNVKPQIRKQVYYLIDLGYLSRISYGKRGPIPLEKSAKSAKAVSKSVRRDVVSEEEMSDSSDSSEFEIVAKKSVAKKSVKRYAAKKSAKVAKKSVKVAEKSAKSSSAKKTKRDSTVAPVVPVSSYVPPVMPPAMPWPLEVADYAQDSNIMEWNHLECNHLECNHLDWNHHLLTDNIQPPPMSDTSDLFDPLLRDAAAPPLLFNSFMVEPSADDLFADLHEIFQ
jgi:hypothetical protein